MAKVPLVDVGSLGNPSSARQNINENNQRIEDAFDNFISRDGTGPNQMEADFDAGGYKLLNVADPVNDNDAVNLRSVKPLVDQFAADIVSTTVFGEIINDTYTAAASQTVFTLSQPPGNILNTEVTVDGLMRRPTLDYTLSGVDLRTLTFLTPLTLNQKVQVRYSKALPSGTTTAGSVTYGTGTVQDQLDGLSAATGSNLVGFKYPATGTIARTTQEKLAEQRITPQEFMTTAQRADVASNTASLNVQAALQAACDYLYNLGGGELYLPPGVYRLTSPVVVKNGVNIIGAGTVPYKTGATNRPRGGGSWLHFDHPGLGFDVTASPEAVGTGVVMRNFGTFRTHATPAPGWTPTVYDWDIQNAGMDLLVEDVTLLNPYKGIRIFSAGFGRLHVNRLKMQAFNTGIWLEQSYDTCKLENVHQWPFWSDHTAVRTATLNSLIAYKINRADNSILDKCFSIYHQKGIVIDGNGGGETAHALRITNCNIDPGGAGLQLLTGANGATIFVENTVICGADEVPLSFGMLVECNNAHVALSNTYLLGMGAYALTINGTGNEVSSANMRVLDWNKSNTSIVAIQVSANNFFRHSNTTFSGGNSAVTMAGGGTNRGHLGGAAGSGTTDANGILTVAHGLRCRPRGIVPVLYSDTSVCWSIVSADATNVQIKFRVSNTTSPVASTALAVYIDYFDVFPA